MENQLKEIIEKYFENSDYKLVDLVFRGEKGTKVVEIFADSEEGVNIDILAKINHDLNELADTQLIIKDLSKIVVSSPGAERPFKFFWQLKKHKGRNLEIVMNNGEKITGKLTGTEESGNEMIHLETIGSEKGKKNITEERILNFSDIKESKVKISFNK
ncbi:MAG: hypothetical protein JNJ56_06295 [Ignavibacteria bacterium]|nr:hypothetical protein [Ignavibacteria bacterium]